MSQCVLSREFNHGAPSQRLSRCTSLAGTSERSELAAKADFATLLLERVNRARCMNVSEELKHPHHSAWTIKS